MCWHSLNNEPFPPHVRYTLKKNWMYIGYNWKTRKIQVDLDFDIMDNLPVMTENWSENILKIKRIPTIWFVCAFVMEISVKKDTEYLSSIRILSIYTWNLFVRKYLDSFPNIQDVDVRKIFLKSRVKRSQAKSKMY